MSRLVCCLWLVCAILFPAQDGLAGIFDSFLMPGPVIDSHAKFENECNSCHLDLEKNKQTTLCLDCHDHADIAKDIKDGKGFHGKNPNVKKGSCKSCHTEHKGRNKQIVQLDKSAFDHKITDFSLKGAHQQILCQSCHLGKKYSQAKGLCVDCHKNDDVHESNLGEKCSDCHNEKSWKEKKFNHDKDTKYPLKGKHAEVDCDLCHIGKKYKDIPKTCIACHQINDVHNTRNGEKCGTCHVNDKWSEINFNHKRDAKYELTGRHRKLSCVSCHKGDLYKDKLKKTCNSCHRKDDVHNGKNGQECKQCHTTDTWKESSFNHDKNTEFKLKGNHRQLACESCHKTAENNKKLGKTCYTCHEANDVHKGQLGQACDKCHNEEGWGNEVFFQHDLTNFPLIGQHAVVACESCHLSGQFQDADSACDSCHEADDIHEKRLGMKCELCHNPNGWPHWLFDHDTQTEFTLKGKHAGLDCLACHKKPFGDDKKMKQVCIACHRKDDEHNGRFGIDCARCHNEESFSDISYGN